MIWMAITADEYETPLVVEDSLRRMGKALGITDCAVCRMAKKKNISMHKFNGCHYKVVVVAEEE